MNGSCLAWHWWATLLVIARGAKRAVAVQLDSFVVSRSETPRNDKLYHYPLALAFRLPPTPGQPSRPLGLRVPWPPE